jgi:hypothetical protein
MRSDYTGDGESRESGGITPLPVDSGGSGERADTYTYMVGYPSLRFDLTLEVMTLLRSSKSRTCIQIVRSVANSILVIASSALHILSMMYMDKS